MVVVVVGGVARPTEVVGVVRSVVDGDPLADDRDVVEGVDRAVDGVVEGFVTGPAPAPPAPVSVVVSAGAVRANAPMRPTVAAPAAPAAIHRARAAACLADRRGAGRGDGAA
jgi:hypothetical protein